MGLAWGWASTCWSPWLSLSPGPVRHLRSTDKETGFREVMEEGLKSHVTARGGPLRMSWGGVGVVA